MPRPRVEVTAEERDALVAAQELFLDWLEKWGPYSRVDREPFNRLAAAARELNEALAPFNEPGKPAHGARLLAFLQGDQALQLQSVYRDHLQWLTGFLVFLEAAAAKGGGKGRQADERSQVWMWTAADVWTRGTGKRPSAVGRFWVALDAFQNDKKAIAKEVPNIGRDQLKAALGIWRVVRKGG